MPITSNHKNRQAFKKRIVFSSILTVIAIVAMIVFSVIMFQRYGPPNESNTTVITGTVTEVYHAVPRDEVVLKMSDGVLLKLVYPTGIYELESALGYDVGQLARLLEGEAVQCRIMEYWPWVVEISAGDIKIDNYALTVQQAKVSRMGIIIVGFIVLALTAGVEAMYLKTQYDRYRKAEKKRQRKEKRELKKVKP